MTEVYCHTGYSKQAFHQSMNRSMRTKEEQQLLLPLVRQLREEHPGVSVRQFYHMLQPRHMGRDKFERMCFAQGLKLKRSKAYKRTTDSRGVRRFDNFLSYMELKAVNRVWVSDITYYELGGRCYYLTFIMDLYSRMIKGYSVSKRLYTEVTSLPALMMALQNATPGEGLIFHSDGGGQYYCKAFLQLTRRYGMYNSMCESVYENAGAERVNGTIKNQYLAGYRPQSFEQLIDMSGRAVNNYNHVRPHQALGGRTPAAFDSTGLPAGGDSSEKNDFCSCSMQSGLHRKNHSSQMSSTVS